MNLNDFHFIDKNGKPTAVFDNAIFEHLRSSLKLFVTGGTPYIYRAGVFVPDHNGAMLKSEIKKCILPQFVRSTTIERIYKLFLMDAELQKKPEELNQFPKHWINFLNGFYDPVEQVLLPHSPIYYSINQIPHEINVVQKLTGSKIDEWLSFITPDASDKEMLLQYLGYCMTADTRQQKFLILCGAGGTGKSTIIRMIEHVIGRDNISNISLRELSLRFASYGLMGKLMNSCADLEMQALEDTSVLKKVLGEDSLRAEAKGKDAISFNSYAKLIFSTNELPLVLNEKTNGFYRRLLILNMNQQPPVMKHDFLESLQAETDYFIQQCIEALHRMYQQGRITESYSSLQAVQGLRKDSDTIEAWLADKCTLDENSKVERTALFNNYELYCRTTDRTALTRNSFYRSLRMKGFRELKTTLDGDTGTRCFEGIALGKHAVSDDPSLPF